VHKDGRGYLLLLVAAAAWSTSGLFIRWTVAISGLSALSLAFWRDLATFVCALLGLTLLRPAWLRVQRQDLPWFLALGAVGVGVFHFLWGVTILNIGYAAATVLLYAAPAYVTLMAWLLWREPLTRFKILAVLMTFAGCVLVAGREQLAAVDLTAGGLILGLVTALAYGSFSLLGRHVAPRYSPWTVLVYSFGFGALALLPFQLATTLAGAPSPWLAPPETWIWFAGLVLIATIVPFAAYVAGLRWLPVSVASIIIAAEVAFGALIGYIFFDETLTPAQILGAALVAAGVVLITITGNGRPSHLPST
jgi:DME family drug/metabolite transporter